MKSTDIAFQDKDGFGVELRLLSKTLMDVKTVDLVNSSIPPVKKRYYHKENFSIAE